jgi:hypothetical protein
VSSSALEKEEEAEEAEAEEAEEAEAEEAGEFIITLLGLLIMIFYF